VWFALLFIARGYRLRLIDDEKLARGTRATTIAALCETVGDIMPKYGITQGEGGQIKARAQANTRGLRIKGFEWKFEPLRETREKAWLKANTICETAIATPAALKRAIKTLEVWLGNPNWRASTKHPGLARVSSVRIKGTYSTSGPVRKTIYKPTDRYDYFDGDRDQNVFVTTACADIVEEFLRASGYGSFLHAILNMKDEAYGGYRVYAHVDWYPSRRYDQQSWHKDTRGSTLFVGLVYMNQGEIQGPDIISNPWPLPRTLEQARTPQCLLPPELKGPIDEILMENQAQGPMKIRQTPKIPEDGGVVWFVDELVHHRTPQKAASPKVKLAISEKELGSLEEGTVTVPDHWDSDFNVDDPRKFVRIWVTLDKKEVVL
jgi:hypothetical protein